METTRWIIKLNFLLLALSLAIYAIVFLRHRSINPNILNALGLSAHQAQLQPAPHPQTFPHSIIIHATR